MPGNWLATRVGCIVIGQFGVSRTPNDKRSPFESSLASKLSRSRFVLLFLLFCFHKDAIGNVFARLFFVVVKKCKYIFE